MGYVGWGHGRQPPRSGYEGTTEPPGVAACGHFHTGSFVVAEYRAKLQQRIEQLLDAESSLDEYKFGMEVAVVCGSLQHR